MALTSPEAPARLRGTPAFLVRRPHVLIVAGLAFVALATAGLGHAHRLQGVPDLIVTTLSSLILFVVCGDSLAQLLVTREWGIFRPLSTLPLGAAASGLVLTAFGLAHVPLHVSLWVTLAGGILASVLVRRRARSRSASVALEQTEEERAIARRRMLTWAAVLFILLAVVLLPAFRNGADTIYGENPDSQQVIGVTVLFQHVPPTATDNALPLDVVPPAWRFRYPIFYALAGASNLTHSDPIRVFPAMAALLMLTCALGFAALAVRYLRVPEDGGPLVAAAIAFSWIVLHSGWHPYWNQLWGLAMFPWALLFGWRAVADRDGAAAVLFVLMLVMLELAYPLALPYPVVVFLALLVGYGVRPRLPRGAGLRRWILPVVGVCILAPAVAAAAVKLITAIGQIVSANSALWGGDVTQLLPIGQFAGTGGGWLPALAVLILALFGLRTLPRRVGISVGVVLCALLALDIRFRTASTGAYMDFKHLSFVGLLVITLAAGGLALLARSRSRRLIVIAAILGLAWTAAAVNLDRKESIVTGAQVSPQQFQIRQWAARLPPGASVRVDIPASGWQLWAVYMLGAHPVDSPHPVVMTTYAHAPYGWRADYSLAFRVLPTPSGRPLPAPVPPFARNPPVFENSQYVLRRIVVPPKYAYLPQTASQRLVEP